MLLIAIALLGLPLYASAAYLLARQPVWAIRLVLGLYLFDVITIATDGISLGIQIYPGDMIFLVLFGAALLRFGLGISRKVDWILLAVVALFFVSLLRGFAAYGIKQTGVEARGVFYTLTSALYFSTCPMSRRFLKGFCNIWLHCCAVLLALAAFRWTATLLGLSIVSQFAEIVGENRMRVINAGSAFFLATGFLMSFYLESNKKGPLWQRKMLYYIGPVIVLLQHRTVWLLLIVSFLWMAWRDRRFRKWLPIGAALMVVVGSIITAILFRSGGFASASLSDSATNDSTFLWRLGGWIQLLGDFFSSSLGTLLFGKPFGAGWSRVLNGGVVNAAPHNYYVQIMLRTGFIGLLALLLVYRKALRKLRTCELYPSWRFWTVAIVAQVIYNITYGVNYEQGVILGIAIAMSPVANRKLAERRSAERISRREPLSSNARVPAVPPGTPKI